MPELIGEYLDKINPDIIVITGHDLYNQQGLKNIENYTNTKYYMETVKIIRKRKSRHRVCFFVYFTKSLYLINAYFSPSSGVPSCKYE